jgi:ubiquinone/menaquinone biosynthesis C-methylase UbiE
MASNYQCIDSVTHTGYYTLVNLLKLPEATNILEIACGTSRMLPYALTLKQNQCPYLATDITWQMVQLSK